MDRFLGARTSWWCCCTFFFRHYPNEASSCEFCFWQCSGYGLAIMIINVAVREELAKLVPLSDWLFIKCEQVLAVVLQCAGPTIIRVLFDHMGFNQVGYCCVVDDGILTCVYSAWLLPPSTSFAGYIVRTHARILNNSIWKVMIFLIAINTQSSNIVSEVRFRLLLLRGHKLMVSVMRPIDFPFVRA